MKSMISFTAIIALQVFGGVLAVILVGFIIS